MAPTTLAPETKSHPQPLSDPAWDERVRQHLLAKLDPAGPQPSEELLREAVEHWRLAVLFPNQWVVFRDVWRYEHGENVGLLRREVYFVSPDAGAAREFYHTLPDDGAYFDLTFVD